MGLTNGDRVYGIRKNNIGTILNMLPIKFVALNLPQDYVVVSEPFTLI